MTNILITEIGKQLNIVRASESESEWACRVIYSAAGKMALASLWDHLEDETAVSIQHFKKRAEQIYTAFFAIYPDVEHYFHANRGGLLDDLYSIYRRTGYLYHSPHQVAPAAPRVAVADKVTLCRGMSLDSKMLMSGLGLYAQIGTETHTQSVSQMYGLQEQSMNEYLDELLSIGEWSPIEWPTTTQFLRISPPFSQEYWKEAPDTDGKISLASYGEINRIYVFYRYEKGRSLQKQIPAWRTQDFRADSPNDQSEYRRIANALLLRYNARPVIKAEMDGSLVLIQIGYRLPPSEEDFFKLYSWPVNYEVTTRTPQVFMRKMAMPVYLVFKQQLEAIGYHFMEE